MKTIKFVALLAILFLFSCASPMQKKLLSGWEPYYSGEITPITIPIQLKYKPVSLKEKTLMVVIAQVGGKNEALEEMSVEVYRKISGLEDALLWEVRTTTPNKFEMKMLTDVYGNVKKFDVPSSEHSDIITSMIKQNLNALPQKPVRSGDVFNKINLCSYLNKLLSDANILPSQVNLETNCDDMQGIIRGWVYFEGKKAMLVSIDSRNNKFNFTSKELELKFIMDANGYQLVDPDTLQNFYSEFLMVFRMEIAKKDKYIKGVVKMFSSTKSEFY